MGRKDRRRQKARAAALCFMKRDQLLADLGYTTYRQYLRSPLWREIRSRVMAASPPCVHCRRRATQVHHVRYTTENLSGESTDWLVPMCGRCHKRLERLSCPGGKARHWANVWIKSG